MMDSIVDQLKHLRAVHATLVVVCFVAFYALLSQAEAPRATREVRALRSAAALAIASPEVLMMEHQIPWVNERTEEIRKDLSKYVSESLPLIWNGSARDTTRGRLVRAIVPRATMTLGDASLENLRAAVDTRPARVEYMSTLDRCDGSIRRIGPEYRLRGRTLEVVGVRVQHWPVGDRPGNVKFLVLDSRDLFVTGRRSEGVRSPDTQNVLEEFRCTFKAERDTVIPAVTADWFDRTFPALAANWDQIARLRNDLYEAREEARASMTRGEEKIEILGVATQARSLGFVVPFVIASLLGYMSTVLRQLRSHSALAAPDADSGSSRELSPWVCTYSDRVSMTLGVLSLVVAPFVCVLLSIPDHHSDIIRFLGGLAVAILGATVVSQGLQLGESLFPRRTTPAS